MKPLSLALLAFAVVATAQTTTIPILTPSGLDPTGANDSGAAIRAAAAANSSASFYFPAGTYKITSTVTLNRNQIVFGVGPKTTVFNCTMTTTPCFVIADTISGTNYGVTTIEQVGFAGSSTSNAGAIGVYIGGDPAGVYSSSSAFGDAVDLNSVRIAGFYSGVQYGNNAYSDQITQSDIAGNYQGVYYPSGLSNSGELMSMAQTRCFNNSTFCLNNTGGGWSISSGSMDYNGTDAIQTTGGQIFIWGEHIEQNTAPIAQIPSGTVVFSMRDCNIVIQGTSGTVTDLFDFYAQGLQLTLSGLNIAQQSGYTISSLLRSTGTPTTGVVENIGSAYIANLFNTPYLNPKLIIQSTPWQAQTLYAASGSYALSNYSCSSTYKGYEVIVSDATSPTYLGTYTSGGSSVVPVVCNGSAWQTH